MEIKLLSCPLCLKPHFNGVEALRTSLINVATTRLTCPVCNELLLGLDKLTIHLFSHVHNISTTTTIATAAPSITASVPTIVTNEPMIVNITIDNQPTNITAQATTTNPIIQPEQLTIEPKPTLEHSSSSSLHCDICNFSFTDETILDMHQKLLHQVPSSDKDAITQKYHCHLCTKKFKMRGSLMVHLRVAHYGFNSVLPTSNNNNNGNLRNHIKDVSSSSPTSLTSIVEMDITAHKMSPSQNDKCSIASPEAENKNSKTENKQWECDVCSKMFTTKYFLKKHKRLHTGEMPYYCAQCNKSFTFQQSYHKHMLYHTAEKPHVCNECGRAFKELSTLHNHERIHSGERPFACETCGKCFRQRVSYLVHRRIHTGAMPYKCTACDKSFRYKVSQRSHKCSAHPPGSVVRTPDLLQKLLMIQNSQISINNNSNNTISTSNNVNSNNNHCADIRNSSNNNDNPLLEISTDTINGVFTAELPQQNVLDISSTSVGVHNLLQDTPDFFSIVLSPQMPDVQALCLSPDNNKETALIHSANNTQPFSHQSTNSVLETINEESLKNLLYGHN